MTLIRSLMMLVLAVLAGEGAIFQTSTPAGVALAADAPTVVARTASLEDGVGAPAFAPQEGAAPLGARATSSGLPWMTPLVSPAVAGAAPQTLRRRHATRGSADCPPAPVPPAAPRVALQTRIVSAAPSEHMVWPAHGIRAGPRV